MLIPGAGPLSRKAHRAERRPASCVWCLVCSRERPAHCRFLCVPPARPHTGGHRSHPALASPSAPLSRSCANTQRLRPLRAPRRCFSLGGEENAFSGGRKAVRPRYHRLISWLYGDCCVRFCFRFHLNWKALITVGKSLLLPSGGEKGFRAGPKWLESDGDAESSGLNMELSGGSHLCFCIFLDISTRSWFLRRSPGPMSPLGVLEGGFASVLREISSTMASLLCISISPPGVAHSAGVMR